MWIYSRNNAFGKDKIPPTCRYVLSIRANYTPFPWLAASLREKIMNQNQSDNIVHITCGAPTTLICYGICDREILT